MAKFFGKKQVVLGALVVALGAAVYLNYYLAQQPIGTPDANTPTTQTTVPDKELGEAINVNSGTTQTAQQYFEEARKNRETSREEATELVKEVLNDVKASDEQKQAVVLQVAAMAKAIEQESKIEELVKAKGFAECIAYIEGDRCSLVVQSEQLSVQDTAKISQVVMAQSGISAENINIVSVK